MPKRAFVRLMPHVLMCFVLYCALLQPLGAAEPWAREGRVVVVGTDRGGLLAARAAYVDKLRREGRRVEIRGRLCLSSCTMFLGAGDVCINPRTEFGFHGPSSYGRPLPTVQFDYWSNVMASHYPAPLRASFMRDWRYRITGYVSLSGAELIRLGFRACPARPGAT